ncbi:hypothetical protein BJY04DRAFT_226222 [Aspergillus karnatakaensis]|uniref:uncharacterized protein n=1 Tax=Aspergillus karnatakaensis TaxID=1810916 RepID=UPI003CCDF5BD
MITLNVLLLLFVPQTLALPESNSTEDRVGWVSDENQRSTSGIIWSCFSIFLVCSWQCTHLHVPSIQESEAGWNAWKRLPYPSHPLQAVFWRRIKWVVVIALAPEVGVGMAMNQYVQARELYLKFKHLGFSMTHAFYASMGGFIMTFPSDCSETEESKNTVVTTASELLPEYHALDADDFATLEALGVFPATTHLTTLNRYLPVTTTADLRDRAKSDLFAKAFALLQCGWLITQSIARVCTGLVLTKLELVTLAFIVIGIVMYGLWWHKPFDVQHTTVPRCPGNRANEAWTTLTTLHEIRGRSHRRTKDLRLKNLDVRDFRSYLFARQFRLTPVVFNLTSAVFTGLHIAAWNWSFPHRAGMVCWRVFSLGALCSSLTPALIGVMFRPRAAGRRDRDIDQDQKKGVVQQMLLACVVVCLVVYLVSRMGLIVLMFYCFSSMPAGVYEDVDWSDIFPHFS